MEQKQKTRPRRTAGKGQARRSRDGRLPEETDIRGRLLSAAETDISEYGMLTLATLKAVCEAGFRYDNGELLSLEELAARPGKEDGGKYPPVYRLSIGEAKMRGELEQFWESCPLDGVCSNAVASALLVRSMGRNDTISRRLSGILEEFGRDRVEWVLAHSIVHKKDDVHISEENKQWAASFQVPRRDYLGGSFFLFYVVNAPGELLEQAASLVRKELTVDRREPEGKKQKDSILKQLSELRAAGGRKEGKNVADREAGEVKQTER